MRKIVFILCSILLIPNLRAQEFFYEVDLVSKHIWRAMDNGGAALQPTAGIEIGNARIYAWGSTEFKKKNNELDLVVEYDWKNLTFVLSDYYFQEEGMKFQFFKYNPHTTGHTFEIGAVYTLSQRIPFSLGWYTTFAGNDYFRENGNRAWSSYLEASYPFEWLGFDFGVEAAVTPWEGMYADKFNVVNLGLSIAREIPVSRNFRPAVSGKFIYNPAEEKFFFVFGIHL